MSSDSARADVAGLLETLREEAARQPRDVRFRQVDLVRRVSEHVKAPSGSSRLQANVPAMLGLLSDETSRLTSQVRFYDVGTVQQIGNDIATLSGLPNVATDQLVNFPTGVRGLVLNLDRDHLDVILLGTEDGIQGGDLVTTAGERLQIPVGHPLLGRVVNPLGEPRDAQGPVEGTRFSPLERDAPSIIERGPVHEPLHTGLKIIDALVPIGRGQRELIIGDRHTGKTTLALDAILNQRSSDVACVYVAIGQKKSSTLSVIETLSRGGAMPYTTVVVSSPDDPPALRYLAPYAGCTIAESLMEEGRDVMIVYDSLSKHADSYRELSLLLRRPPGREAYPGDVFYLHSRLLERACKLSDELGGRSITALPIVEIQRGNISGYIPTNLISITDGQIMLDANLFNRGTRPAVNVGQSVSRVGGAAQTAAMLAVARNLRLELAQFEDVAQFARLGTDVDETTHRQIQRGERLHAALQQPANQPFSLAAQIVALLAATEGFLDDIALRDVSSFEDVLLASVTSQHPELDHRVSRTGELPEGMRSILMETIANCHAGWRAGRDASSPTRGAKL